MKSYTLIEANPRFATTPHRGKLCAVLLTLICGVSLAHGQISVLTQHYDNARTGQNTQETILTHANVNQFQFGKLFTQSIDGFQTGQPLYVPNVYIPALNATHNVVYVATMHDSVYAFDADNNQGSNASPLWQVSFLDLAHGITSVPVADEKCFVTGYTEFGIQDTPVIDVGRNAIYLEAVTKENGNYVHKLHALDLGTGEELFGGPATITASVTIDGQVYSFVPKYQQVRPALLLQDGTVYIGFGGPGCNIATEMGWVMAYNADTLQQVGAFNTSPGITASAVWLSGAGLAGDGAGNVYANTGDGLFDADTGGNHYGDSVLKFHQGDGVLNLVDFFTPYNQQFLNERDLDVSSGQILLLPEQPNGNYTLQAGKDGTIYVLDQDNMGQYNPAGDIQIPQEVAAPVLGEVHAGLTYWNNTVYLEAEQTPILAYSFTNGQLSPQPISQTPVATSTPKGGIVSANGTQDGIFWYVTFSTKRLFAFDATNLATELYDNGQAGSRDTLGPLVHFGMPIVANGRLYVNGQSALTVFGLLNVFSPVGGNQQSGIEGTQLPLPLQAALHDSYSGQPIATPGIPVTFTANPKLGVFSNPNSTTDNSGTASTNFTLPSKPGTYTITAASPGYASAIFTVTATGGTATALAISSGNAQKVPVLTQLAPVKVKAKDASGKGVSGVVVSFNDGGAGGSFSSTTATTDSSGVATTTYTAGTKAGVVKITASATGASSAVFNETVLPGPATAINVLSGNNQIVKAGKPAAKLLGVVVTDQYGNPVKGISVSYTDNGAGGSLTPDPAVTTAKGSATSRYTAPASTGTVTVTASVAGIGSVNFTIQVD
ncbi:MAG TPA: hypothetical protein VNW47_10045 [Terriglobales bacterium]|jgi:hypothetical protein|nr:hypothetical protein [Terriglobales bacterium]